MNKELINKNILNELETKEFLENIKNNTFLSDCVKEFYEERTIENYIYLCEVLSYRDVYICGANFNEEEKRFDDILTCQLSVSSIPGVSEEVICVYSDPTKINFEEIGCNIVGVTTLRDIFSTYFNDETFHGIIINVHDEQIPVPYRFIKLILNNKIKDLRNLILC